MYADDPIRKYLDDASSGRPSPGGGSVTALTGALGASMACMAANFTVGKRKFAAVEPQVRELLARCEQARDELLRLTDADVQAYATVAAAYALPKESEGDRTARSQAIQEALRIALTPPLQTLRVCRELLPAVAALAEKANPNLISDVGVAALLADAALRAAKLNVEINLREMKDAEFVAATRAEIAEAARLSGETRTSVLRQVTTAIGGAA